MYSYPVIKWLSELITGLARRRRATRLPGRAEDHGKSWSGVSVRPVWNPSGTEMPLFTAAAWLCVTLRTKGIFSSPNWLLPVSWGEWDTLFLDYSVQLHYAFIPLYLQSHMQKIHFWLVVQPLRWSITKTPFRSAVIKMHKNCCFNLLSYFSCNCCCLEGF